MGALGYQVITDDMAIHRILIAGSSQTLFLGAGASVEAGVPTAEAICQEVAEFLVAQRNIRRAASHQPPLSGQERAAILAEELDWEDRSSRYFTCIRRHCVTPADRVEFFRKKLEGVQPSFAHYAVALLMQSQLVSQSCLTINFDKLLENAFTRLGDQECQPIRLAAEASYWQRRQSRAYVLKLHGDYDTQNVLNTEDETIRVDKVLVAKARDLLRDSGLLVLGVAGNEKSIFSLFDELTTDNSRAEGILSRGLLWAVYVGERRPEDLTEETAEQLVAESIAKGSVGPEITKLMVRNAKNANFAFFPIWGCGSFLLDLLERTDDRKLAGRAEQYLDHDLRVRRVFSRAGLADEVCEAHIKKLRATRRALSGSGSEQAAQPAELGLSLTVPNTRIALNLVFGDISDPTLLGAEEFLGKTRAVTSPEDTLLSLGGGAALSLANRAGLMPTLHELGKFSPIDQCEVCVTSAGSLPVHYLFHAATIQVTDDGYAVSAEVVEKTVTDLLGKAMALGVQVCWLPLLGAGTAGLPATESLQGILEAVQKCRSLSQDMVINVTAFDLGLRADLEAHLMSFAEDQGLSVSRRERAAV